MNTKSISSQSAFQAVQLFGLMPLLLVAAVIGNRSFFTSPWHYMWAVAFSVYGYAKWYTWWTCTVNVRWLRSLGYLLFWPGMHAKNFLSPSPTLHSPSAYQWWLAVGRITLGAGLLWLALPRLSDLPEVVIAWIGMIGVALILHFGLFDLLAFGWRQRGVAAERLMNNPVASTSVAEYWGKRWNTAFRDLANNHLFRPLSRRVSPTVAMLVVFLASGIIHDLVISVPAKGGYGLPTLFFLLQALAIVIERSPLGKRLGLMRGIKGWAFTFTVILLPAPLLFHAPFLNHVVLPMLSDIGALGN